MKKKELIPQFWLKVMKITLTQLLLALFFTTVSFANDTHAQGLLDQKLSLSVENMAIKDVLAKIETELNVRFSYNPRTIGANNKINLKSEEKSLNKILTTLFKNAGITYELVGSRQIILTTSPSEDIIEPLSSESMRRLVSTEKANTITGKVTDEKGEPLVGANVVLEGTTKGTLTDLDGNFSLDLTDEERAKSLEISFVGYDKIVVLINGQTSFTIVLKEGKVLDQVVVVGYGTQKKSDVTGSVASVSRERLEQLPNTNIAQAIQGSLPGVQINTNTGGAEGNDNSILIRGRNSISASTAPLIIWDGIPYTGGISEINPNDVESIEVLKDASAAAIYGARASNGVLLVTSKQGKKGKLTITYDGSYGVQNIATKPNLMTGQQFYDFKKNRANVPANSITPSEQAVYDQGKAVDWFDLATQQGARNQQTLSVSGGTDKISFYVGGTYLNVQGVSLNDQFKRYSLRPNLDIKVTPWLTVASSSQFSMQDRSGIPADYSGQFGALNMDPLTTALNDDGTPTVYAWPEYNTSGNPLSNLNVLNKDNGYRIFSANNVKVDIPFVKGLSYKLNTGIEFENDQRKTYYGANTATGYENKGSATNYNSVERNFTVENILSYIRDFGKNSVGFTALYSSQSHDYDRDQLKGVGFPNDVLTNYQMNTATLLTPSSTNFTQNLISQMARLNYSYDSKYLLTLTARRDGYSGFGVNTKYGIFPSIALGWNIHNENFMKKQKLFSNLKLRGSYGLNGNQAVDSYQSLATLATRQYLNGTTVLTGYVPSKLANEKLGWESTLSTTLGLDFGLLNDRIQGSIDVYSSNTSDLLLNRIISSVQGFDRVLQNIGKTANKGIELGITSVNIKTQDFKWSTTLNLSHNENKIVDLYGDGRDDVANSWFIGRPIRTIYGLQNDGIFRTQAEIDGSPQAGASTKLGYVRVKDVDGDGKISTTLDRTFLGNGDPNLIFGFSNTFKYKGLSLMVFLQGVQGVTKENTAEVDDVFGDVRRNTTLKDWWSTSNPNGSHFANDALANVLNVKFYEDASYARLKDVSLAYEFSSSLIQKWKIARAKIYISGRNLATFTKFRGFDPEFNISTDSPFSPLQKEIVFGINLQL